MYYCTSYYGVEIVVFGRFFSIVEGEKGQVCGLCFTPALLNFPFVSSPGTWHLFEFRANFEKILGLELIFQFKNFETEFGCQAFQWHSLREKNRPLSEGPF